MKTEAFKLALEVVLKHEGGYVNHPHDKGGATNKGITQATYNYWLTRSGGAPRSVKDITDFEAEGIYYTMYWLPSGAHQLPDKLALVHFDSAVNHGRGRAVKFLQQAVCASVDGVFGAKTKESLAAALALFGEDQLVKDYLDARACFYDDLVDSNPTQAVFSKGWANRIAGLRKATGLT